VGNFYSQVTADLPPTLHETHCHFRSSVA